MLRIIGGPVRRRAQRPIPTRSFLDDPYDPNHGISNQVIIDTVHAYYVANGQVSDSPATDSLLVYLHLYSYSDNYTGNARNQPVFRDEAALFCALGWYVRGNETLRQFAKAHIDVRLGNHHLMRVLFAYVTSDRDSQQYTSFDSTRNGYIHYPIAGSYVSQMRDIPSYLILFRDLYRSFESQDVLDMIRLAAYHDFMAFLTISYRNSMDTRTTSVNTLGRFLQSAEHALHHNIMKILMVIAKAVMPAPDQPIPQQQQRRLSVAVMSAPSASYMPQSSSEEDEDGEESTVHNKPDYHEDRYSTHSTPIAHRAPTRTEVANIAPRRITHPGGHPRVRTPTGPSPMRAAFPERSPPAAKARSPAVAARSPAVRLPLRSPARGSLKRKATTPQQYIRPAVEQCPVSPL